MNDHQDIQRQLDALAKEAHFLFPHTLAKAMLGPSYEIYAWVSKVASIIVPMLMKGGARICITTPPRVGKSFTFTQWLSIWWLQVMESNVMVAAYNADLAADFGRYVRNTLQVESRLPVRLSPDSTSVTKFATSRGTRFFAQGIGGSFTGKGAGLFVIDDPYKDWKEAQSKAWQSQVFAFFDSVVKTRLEPGGNVVVTHTRWSQKDLIGKLVKMGYFYIDLPALCIDPSTDLLKRAKDEALCPERYDDLYYKGLVAEGPDQMEPMIFQALYQCRPALLDGNLFKDEYWSYYPELPAKRFRRVQFWDTAQKPGLSNDYSVCSTYDECEHGYYLVDVTRGKFEAPDLEQAMVECYDKHKPNVVVVEDTSAGASAIPRLKRKRIPVQAWLPKMDKESRAIGAVPTIAAGKWWLPERASWLEEFKSEHRDFPTGEHDDQVDTTTMAYDWFTSTPRRSRKVIVL